MESFESDLMRLKDLPLVDDKPVMHVEWGRCKGSYRGWYVIGRGGDITHKNQFRRKWCLLNRDWCD
jgi:hypothetical protein